MAARFVALAFALMTAIFAGTLAGNAAVAGMNGLGEGYAPPMIGDERAMLAGLPENPAVWAPPEAPKPGFSLASAEQRPDCLDCSDYEAGYRWAAAHDLADTRRCAGDSAAFAEGCAAWVDDGEAASRGGDAS